MIQNTLYLYDQAILDLMACEFAPIIPRHEAQLFLLTPERKFIDYLSGRTPENLKLALPRISITRMNDDPDEERRFGTKIRKIPDPESAANRAIIADPPTPIIINYQIDMWTQHMWEMNYWRRKMMMLFWNLPPRYILVDVGYPWGEKYIEVYLDGSGDHTSDLEPDEADRTVRYTYTLRVKAHLFPLFEEPWRTLDELFYELGWLVERIRIDVCDMDTEELYWSETIPHDY